MRAIETEYKGIKFRSKLEAQWAVFFDECGAKWDYEPEGFDLGDGVWYLPDFLLHDILIDDIYGGDAKRRNIYVEVKGEMRKGDLKKIKHFVFGDYNTVRKNVLKQVNFWLGDNDIDNTLGIPQIDYETINPLAILGNLPKKSDFDDISEWYERNNYWSGENKAIYCYNHLHNFLPFVRENQTKFLPMLSDDRKLLLAALETVNDSDLTDTIDAYYKAVNYRFDHKK